MLRSRTRNPARSPVPPRPAARMGARSSAGSRKPCCRGPTCPQSRRWGWALRGMMDQVAPIVSSSGDVAARAQRWLARAAIDVRASTLVQIAALTTVYFATAKLGIDLKVAHGVVTPVWAPSGISLVALVLFGNRLWPGVALGAFLANASSHVSVPTAMGIATGNTLEALVGAYLLARVAGFRSSLGRVQDVPPLIVLASV